MGKYYRLTFVFHDAVDDAHHALKSAVPLQVLVDEPSSVRAMSSLSADTAVPRRTPPLLPLLQLPVLMVLMLLLLLLMLAIAERHDGGKDGEDDEPSPPNRCIEDTSHFG